MTSSLATDLPTHADVVAAGRVLEGYAVRTPLLESPLLNGRLGGRLLIKAECLQRTGSFKFRGAFNRLCRLDQDSSDRGVVAYSSGNHAQGVAHAAALLGIRATIVMPSDAPRLKLAATRAYGARIVLYDRETEDREAIGASIADSKGLTLVRPYDDPWIISGQGSVALEAVRQAESIGARPEVFAAPCGGGGLISGCALALTEILPECTVLAVEPEGHDDTVRSLAGGNLTANTSGRRSFCDALLAPRPGDLTFAINRCLLAGGVAVPDTATAEAMRAAFEHFKLVAEPGGAVALAAILEGRIDIRGRTAIAVVSGGNVDPELFTEVLSGHLNSEG